MPWDLSMEKIEGAALGETIYKTACLSCHGNALEGNKGIYSNIPSISNHSNKISKKDLKSILINGKGIKIDFKSFFEILFER
jgi:cytochrome c553